jgi:hypothetical protein
MVDNDEFQEVFGELLLLAIFENPDVGKHLAKDFRAFIHAIDLKNRTVAQPQFLVRKVRAELRSDKAKASGLCGTLNGGV